MLERIVEFYQRAKKLYAAILAGLAPLGVEINSIFEDGQLTAEDVPHVLVIGSIVAGWFGVYWLTNKVGAVSRKR